MFDLFRSGHKLVKYVLGGLLLIVAASMVTYLIPSYGNSGLVNNSPVIAEVGGQKITALYAQQTFERVTRGSTIPPEMIDIYLPQFVDQLILQHAADYEAQRIGLTVSDDEVLTGMIVTYPQFFPGGVLANRDQLEQYFTQQENRTLEDAIEDMRNQMLRRKLQDALLITTVVMPKEVEEAFTNKYAKAKIDYIAFPNTKFRDLIKLEGNVVRDEFDRSKANYTIPEKNTYQVVVLDQTKVEAGIVISDAQLRQAYAGSMDNFRMPERIHARHILIKTEGKSDTEKAQLKTKAEGLLKQLKGGADFAELAKKSSEDPGSGQKGGDLDWLVKGQTVPEFEAAAFALKPNELSGIVTTQFGYHIIQVLAHEPPRVKPLEEVKTALADELKKQSIAEKMQTLADQMHAALVKNPTGAADVAKQVGAEVINMKSAKSGDPIPTLGPTPEIDSILPSMKPGQVSDVLVLPSNRMAVITLESKSAPRPAEFSEVEPEVRNNILELLSKKMAEDRANEAAERLKKGEEIHAVAKSMNLEVVSSSDFGLSDSVEGLGQAVYVQEAFNKPVGTILGPSLINGRQVVSRVTSKTPANMAAFPAERETLLKEIKRKRATDRQELLMDSIRTKLVNDGKVRIYNDEIQKMVATFRKR
jgi:peptidyl-prolyl cis-trans isomerase D